MIWPIFVLDCDEIKLDVQMNRFFRFSILASLSLTTPITAQAANMAPHRAIYDLLSDTVTEKSGIRKVEGRMAFEVMGSECEGWSVSYRLANRYSNTDGSQQTFDTQMTSFESGDGAELRINQKQFVDSALSSESKITVTRDKDGEGTGMLVTPAEKSFKVTPLTLFPMGHQAHLLDQAIKGEVRDATPMFDGSDNEKTYRVVSFIGKLKPGKEALANSQLKGPKLKNTESLGGLRAWPMTMTYFPGEDEKAEEPVFQSNFMMFENGVTSSMRFDYLTHTVKAELNSLELLPTTPCK
jgi:EipB-like